MCPWHGEGEVGERTGFGLKLGQVTFDRLTLRLLPCRGEHWCGNICHVTERVLL